MFTKWQLDDLLDLVRLRYPQWDGFDHAPFVADEIEYKRAAIARAGELLGEEAVQKLVNGWQYDELIGRLEQLGRDNNLLFNRVPRRGDLAILYHPQLNEAEFCLQIQKLLYGSAPAPARLDAFATYAFRNNLPNKWTFPTYFLFLIHPHQELFVKPQVARWFLKFLGQGKRYNAFPSGELYAFLRQQAHDLRDALQSYGARDMVHVQSFLWICARESRSRTGRLDLRGQVELDVPPTTYSPHPRPAALHDTGQEPYAALDTEETAPDTAPGNGRESTLPPYSLSELAADTGFEKADLQRWVQAIERKGQAIFYGPPGTGKTMLAQGLARHLSGGGQGFVDLVQFHAAYQYEDFVQGLRPVAREDGSLSYKMRPGRFLNFCHEAARRRDTCVLIVDEINRANVSRVFGELMYLLEYRDRSIPLAAGGQFSIPANVRLIGTMNTADRSIALVDHALRRRFAFIALGPNYDLLRRYHDRHETGFPVEKLISVLQQLNDQIGDPHYEVGITYFLRRDLAAQLEDVWQMEIEPYLEEYFFDRPRQVAAFRWRQIRDQFQST